MAGGIGFSDWLGVCTSHQLVLEIARSEDLDACQAIEIVRVDVGPILGFYLNCLAMSNTDNVRFHDIQLTEWPEVNVASVGRLIKRDSVDDRVIDLFSERRPAAFAKCSRQLQSK